MKKRQTIKTKVGLGLIAAAALVLVIFPIQARPQDMDLDGFTDQEEIQGIVLLNGVVVPGSESQFPREERLDPTTPDLFFILVSATNLDPTVASNLPANPLEFVHKPQADGGLGIVTHEIPYDPANLDRYVSLDSPQKAVRITEDLHPEGNILGYANQGTPNDLDEAIIYTEHIINHVNSVYGDPALVPAGLIDTYIKHTIAHEIGHMTSLAVEYNRRFGGYQYKSGSEVIMEQAVKYTDKKGVITFYISTVYAVPSQEGYRLE
jgi:hypothetical protein